MTTIIVLFNLQDGVDRDAYETWAKNTDLPLVRSQTSVEGFDVYRSQGLLGSDADSPYAYVEIIEVSDMARFGSDISSDAMQKVASEFQSFADAPLFIVAGSIERK
jgi:hypothetical protein